MSKSEIYVSVDIETDGPIAPDNSMLSFGAAAFDKEGKLLSTFSANLNKLPNAIENPDTMAWWSQNQKAYDETRKDLQDPKAAMMNFISWVESLGGKPVFVGYPCGFDFTIMYWYMIHFVGRSPFSFSALDIKSYAMAMLKTDFRETTKRNMPKRWFPKDPHTHVAVQDAIEQGKLFINMMKENLQSNAK
jgi:hypothetical protein